MQQQTKSRITILNLSGAALAFLVVYGVALSAARSQSAPASENNPTQPSKAVVNELPDHPIPQSVFIVPSSTKEGRDPFFPNLTDRFSITSPVKPGKATNSVVIGDLFLQGVAGHTNARICVINGRTFAVGEEGAISTPSGHVQIRCLEIYETNVVIELGGERRELRFKALK